MHAGPIGIENPGDLYFETMLAMIIEEQGLGAALAFIIAGTRSDWVDVSPIVFGLGVDRGIAIYFAGGGLKNTAFEPLGEAEHVDSSVHRRLGRLYGIVLIMDRRSWTSEIVNFVRFDVERERHVVAHEFEARVSVEMLHVSLGACEQIVDAQHLVSLFQQAINEMGSKEAGAARDQNAFSAVIKSWHAFISLKAL